MRQLHFRCPARVARLTVTAVLVLSAACATGDVEERPEAQPVPGRADFGPGIFDELPRYSRSEPLGPRNETDGVVSQSFSARNTDPQQILSFYGRRLEEAGWSAVEPVTELGPGTYRAQWGRPQWLLTVSASTAPTITPPRRVPQLPIANTA